MLPEFKHVIFCDDIRTEDNGKKILIGFYTGALVTETFPFGGKIAILIIADSFAGGESVAVEVRLKSGAKIAELVADIPLPPVQIVGGNGYLELAVPLMLSAEDVLEVRAGPAPDKLSTIGSLPIVRATLPAAP